MPRTPEETRALFDRWAGTYDIDLVDSIGEKGGPLAGYHESLLEAASLVTVSSSTRVLDVGQGTGAFSLLLSARGAEIYGIDPSENMLTLCRQRHPTFTVRAGTFTEIPFDGAAFDGVVSSFAFHEVLPTYRERACKEIVRVTKPGGFVCLLDIMFASTLSREAAKTAIGAYWDAEEDYPLIGELDQVLREAGFVNTFWRQTAPCHWALLARRNRSTIE